MTTLVVVRKNNTVAIAGDSQSTFGDTRLGASYDCASNKIFQIGDAWLGISGSAAHDLVLQAALKKYKKAKFDSRVAIFETFRGLHPILKEQFYLKPDEEEDDPYESSQMTVLLASAGGIFGVYSMREVYAFEKFWAIGSGRDYAIGAMHAVWDQYDNPADIARIGVEAGCQFDINSSLPMTLYTVPMAQPSGE